MNITKIEKNNGIALFWMFQARRNRVFSKNPVSAFLDNFRAEIGGMIAPRGVSLVSGFQVLDLSGNFQVLAGTAMIDFNNLQRALECDYSWYDQTIPDKLG
ncbi:MAG: hypothetical protein QQW96_21600 [Tychonema bourrellyi B0820]|uniref:Uncharacterized protein n=1 Tax=Tychonema bourrellyi FEM_GT703 TaxID=2040638 RepID=A0A2G4EWM8_9CYAN|nr:hypothetical protein [Tychonema bourrellyi]MDQ2100230.1 hypothetical protein [Tychonema bourrellyi B0820]PHX53577.1 hypothetical protein CP500_020765 [Tychonema bourrellyi FEM_GT703]